MGARPAIGLSARSPRALAPLARGIELAGGLPVVVDPRGSRLELWQAYEALAGLLLPGGAGLAWLWHQHMSQTPHGDGRDRRWPESGGADVQLARWAFADGRPVLGICRGAQMMALAAGGRLERDVPGHQLSDAYPAHQVRISPGSRLREVLGAEVVSVNSRHSRAVASLPAESGLAVTAWSAADGIAEGLEGTGAAFALGVQFHPENLIDRSEPCRRLFRGLVAACRDERSL